MAIDGERIVVWPDSSDDFHAGVMSVRMDREQTAARPKRTRERRDHALGLEFQRGPRAIWLRGDDEVVIGDGSAWFRDQRIKQEFVVLAIDDEHHRALIDRIPGLRTHARLPVLGQERFE